MCDIAKEFNHSIEVYAVVLSMRFIRGLVLTQLELALLVAVLVQNLFGIP